MSEALAYFITWTCYGTWLPGDSRGWVNRANNRFDSATMEPDENLVLQVSKNLSNLPYVLDQAARNIVLDAIIAVCRHRMWHLYAAHVRTNHVHLVVSGDATPEKMMKDFKVYASRALNQIDSTIRRWTRHGSTRYLYDPNAIAECIDYTVHGQGCKLSVWTNQDEPNS